MIYKKYYKFILKAHDSRMVMWEGIDGHKMCNKRYDE